MILEEETFEAFGYYVGDLKPRSHKLIIAACELCGEFKETSKSNYRTFCKSCLQKGKHLSEETKRKMSEGNNGKHPSEEARRHMSESKKGAKCYNYGKRGVKSSNYKGGFKLAKKRKASRRRKLGSTFLLMLQPGEVGHHISNECIIGIPEDVHQQFSGYKREKHRALVLEWLKENDPKKYRVCIAALETLFGYP